MKFQQIMGTVLLVALFGVLGHKFWKEMSDRTDSDFMLFVAILILIGTIYLVRWVLRNG